MRKHEQNKPKIKQVSFLCILCFTTSGYGIVLHSSQTDSALANHNIVVIEMELRLSFECESEDATTGFSSLSYRPLLDRRSEDRPSNLRLVSTTAANKWLAQISEIVATHKRQQAHYNA